LKYTFDFLASTMLVSKPRSYWKLHFDHRFVHALEVRRLKKHLTAWARQHDERKWERHEF